MYPEDGWRTGRMALCLVLGLMFELPDCTDAKDEASVGTQVSAASASAPRWRAGTRYRVGDRASYLAEAYQCLEAHTASAGLEPPTAPAYWVPLRRGIAWQAGVLYEAGAVVMYRDIWYRAKDEHQSRAGEPPSRNLPHWERLTRPACPPSPETLSPLARAAYEKAGARDVWPQGTLPRELILTSCNEIEAVLVEGPQIFAGFRDEIARAEHEVVLATFKWEADSQAAALIGEGLRRALEDRREPGKLLVRMLVKDNELPGSGRAIDDLWDSVRAWNLDASKVEIQLATYPHLSLGVLHDKYVVVDSRVLLLTGANVERYHDAPTPWHDTGHILSGDVALSALASFDQAWEGQAKHWRCSDRFGYDCREISHAQADRRWMLRIGRRTGDKQMLALTRDSRGEINNDTDNPQDQGFLAVMNGANSDQAIISPNINDDAFQDGLVDATLRTRVRLLTTLGFNNTTENIPGQGGTNREVVGKLRQRMWQDHPAQRANLEMCWYSQDGIRPFVGNGPGANHTKAMLVDGAVAIVGSGNMDTQSWNHSRELNVLIDHPGAVRLIDGQHFAADWDRAICELVELYEGNDASQDLICSKGALHDQTVHMSSNDCVDDEARSLALHRVPAGRVFRLFDSPEGSREDDWTEVRVKRNVVEKVIGSFERSFEDEDVRVVHHRNNGLDGKVSLYEASWTPAGPVVDLYESEDATQNLLCSLLAATPFSLNFQTQSGCDNDEARSVVLHDIPAGHFIRLYDSPSGSRSDDWLELRVKRTITTKVIGSLEQSFEDADVQATFHPNNGLAGKVSRLEVSLVPSAPTIDLYEGNNGTQNLVCSVDVSGSVTLNFTNDPTCDNDEARSLRLIDVPAGKVIRLYDSPSGSQGDDWTSIETLTYVSNKVIGTFEQSFADGEVIVTHSHDNGLDGKVSRLVVW